MVVLPSGSFVAREGLSAAGLRLGMPPEFDVWHVWCDAAITTATRSTLVHYTHENAKLKFLLPTVGLSHWAGYAFELLGRTVYDVPSTPTSPYLKFPLPESRGHHTLEIWWARLFVPGERIEAEAIWSPMVGYQQAITAAGPQWDGKPLARAARAVRLLVEFERRGRPAQASDEVRAEYLDAARRIVGRGEKLAVAGLAHETSLSVDRTRKRMREHEVSISGLLRALSGR